MNSGKNRITGAGQPLEQELASAGPGTRQETYLTVDELRISYRQAARRGRTLEDWALEHVPRILDRLAECPEDADSPCCAGVWLVFTSPGAKPVIYTVTEEQVGMYSKPNGYLWYGPIPEAYDETAEEKAEETTNQNVNDGIDSPPSSSGESSSGEFDDI